MDYHHISCVKNVLLHHKIQFLHHKLMLWNHYVVPQWTYGKVRSARWDRFGRPDPLPKYGFSGFPTVWWWDAGKAAKVGSRS